MSWCARARSSPRWLRRNSSPMNPPDRGARFVSIYSRPIFNMLSTMRTVLCLFVPAFLLGVATYAPARAAPEFTGDRFPYDAFDTLTTTPITVGGGTLNVAFAPGELALPRRTIMAWLEK